MAYNQQPHATQPMSAAGGNRNANNVPMVDGQREWSHGIFDCLADPLTCLVSWFLPCVSYGRINARYQALEVNGVVSKDPMEGIISNESIMYGVAHCFGCGGLVGMGGRQMVRSRYAIRGDQASDCLLACCCAPCSLTQQSREIELEEQSLGHPGAGLSMFMTPAQTAQTPVKQAD
ncbi:PLAC8-domain-containing protein [Roridomyces roridus]|uniref:PLAC8-domain-containing protein n=1 Tax=Roridomyces roridus TaxID=1738132 RepID=A0AAD7FYD8_9AGAR|nr:PLAC8-domain-containing protein [Roridomyces roridus]